MTSPSAASAAPGTTLCSGCSEPIPAGAPFGQCPRCLIGLARGIAPAPEPMRRRMGDYELLNEVARGGMGVVYRAIQTSLKREVALKLMIGGELSGQRARRMFETEALAAAALHHPHIAAVYDSGEFDLQPFIAIRFIPGGKNIAQWAEPLRATGSWRQIAESVAVVARAVAHAHDRGVLHRDLKPSNILWEEPGGPQITDFGLAKILDAAGDGVTLTAELLGSPGYMAPEQAGGSEEEITTATDVYGLGAVLYELLSGKPPFRGKSALDTARMVREIDPVALTGVPLDLATVCFKCLAKNPGHRYASAQELAEELERFSRGEPVLALPVGQLTRLWRWTRRKPALASLLALTALALTTGISGILWQWQEAVSARAATTSALQIAEAANTTQAETLEHLRWQEMDGLLASGDTSRALARAAAFIRKKPNDWRAPMFAMSVVDTHSFPILTAPPIRMDNDFPLPAQISPDGKWIVHVGGRGMVTVFDAATGATASQFRHMPGLDELMKRALAGQSIDLDSRSALALAVGSGPLPLAISTRHPLVTVRRLPDGPPVSLKIVDQNDHIRKLEYSDDGTHLLGQCRSRIYLWNLNDPQADPMTLNIPDEANHAALSHDGRTILAWSGSLIVVFDVDAGRELVHFEPDRHIVAAALAPRGDRVALLDSSHRLAVWTGPEWNKPARFRSCQASRLSFNADGRRIVLAGTATPLGILDSESLLPVSTDMWTHKWSSDESLENAWLVTARDGLVHATSGLGGTVCLWDAATGRAISAPIRTGSSWEPCGVSLMPDASRILTHRLAFVASRDQPLAELALWRTTKQRPPLRLGDLAGQAVAAVSPDGRLGATLGFQLEGGSSRGSVVDLVTGRLAAHFNLPAPSPRFARFTPDGKKLFAVTEGERQVFFTAIDVATGDALWTVQPIEGYVRTFDVSPDGKVFVASFEEPSANGLLSLDTETGGVLQRLNTPSIAQSARFSPKQSDLILLGEHDGDARLWNPVTGAWLGNFPTSGNLILSIAWSQDGRRFATAAANRAQIFDVETRSLICQAAHSSWLASVAFSADGRTIAIVGHDGTVLLADATTGRPLHPSRRQGEGGESVHFLPDSSALAVFDSQGFRFWDTSYFEPVSIRFPAIMSSHWLSVSLRQTLIPEAPGVFLNDETDIPAIWHLEKPDRPAPAWFPDLLETLALMKVDATDAASLVPGSDIFKIREQIGRATPDDPYAQWARRVLE